VCVCVFFAFFVRYARPQLSAVSESHFKGAIQKFMFNNYSLLSLSDHDSMIFLSGTYSLRF